MVALLRSSTITPFTWPCWTTPCFCSGGSNGSCNGSCNLRVVVGDVRLSFWRFQVSNRKGWDGVFFWMFFLKYMIANRESSQIYCMSNEFLYVTTGIFVWLFLNSEFAISKDSSHLNDANWSNWQYQFPITSTQTVRMNHTKSHHRKPASLINLKVGTSYHFLWRGNFPNVTSDFPSDWLMEKNPATIFVKSRKMALILGGAKFSKKSRLGNKQKNRRMSGMM